MKIMEIDGNNVIVRRGQYGSKITEHFADDIINQVDAVDANLIEVGDPFGFTETKSLFDNDGLEYSSSSGTDVQM